ncbi:MAG: DNA-processing protein DprA [Planctomycetota bacterium]
MPDSGDGSDVLSAVALSLAEGVGPKLQMALLEQFGTPEEVLRQPLAVLQAVHGVGPKTAVALASVRLIDQARQTMEDCRVNRIDILTRQHAGYPKRLDEICDPPNVLFRRGWMLPQDELAIAIVGSRRCTAYGKRHAERLAAALARAGFTIVSGLARGIDAAAHRGAVNAGGRTIAILASGVRDIYPPEHADLAEEIAQQGALLSEMPPDQKPLPGLFPQRNRIISGMCLGVIVIEANRNSGALYTARHAMEQGRDVFALPGPVDSIASEGCHDLIRDGVTLVRNADDVLNSLGPLATPSSRSTEVVIHSPRELALNPLESRVLNLISTTQIHADEILRAAGIESSRVLATLSVLEMKRLIRRLPGGYFVRHD